MSRSMASDCSRSSADTWVLTSLSCAVCGPEFTCQKKGVGEGRVHYPSSWEKEISKHIEH